MSEILDSVTAIAEIAGKEILSVYNEAGPIDVTIKDDQSPLTIADRKANAVIVDGLESLDSSIPVLSEESDQPSFSVRSNWSRYWLVDPLDGTKEFIHRNGEFTVNIALIESGVPTLGVVHVPVSDISYFGGTSVAGAWKRDSQGEGTLAVNSGLEDARTLRIVASRSHRGAAVDRLIQQLEMQFESVDVVSMGSSLKICLLAEASADLYPRLAPTSEWDTAAAHAVLLAAGGEIFTDQFVPLRYNQKDNILNPHFLAVGDGRFNWQQLLQAAMP